MTSNSPFHKFRVLTILLILLFILTGCSEILIKKNSFKEIQADLEWGVLKIKFLGTEKKISNLETIKGPPYSLIVAFDQKEGTPSGCSIILNKIQLINKTTGKTVLSENSMRAYFNRSNISEQNFAIFIFEDLDMDYQQHNIKLEYTLPELCYGEKLNRLNNFLIEKEYKEEKISFFDILLGA